MKDIGIGGLLNKKDGRREKGKGRASPQDARARAALPPKQWCLGRAGEAAARSAQKRAGEKDARWGGKKICAVLRMDV